jgi:hypothetical protein
MTLFHSNRKHDFQGDKRMSGTLATPRALLSLLVAASLVVAGAAQADDVGIKPQDIKREALSSTVVEMAYSTSQQALFVSAPDWKEEARSRVLRLDPNTLAIKAEIPLQVKGFGVALNDAGLQRRSRGGGHHYQPRAGQHQAAGQSGAGAGLQAGGHQRQASGFPVGGAEEIQNHRGLPVPPPRAQV